jgi:DNA-binding HxlR family transcriptional regulator
MELHQLTSVIEWEWKQHSLTRTLKTLEEKGLIIERKTQMMEEAF